jgi:hypothetical protein
MDIKNHTQALAKAFIAKDKTEGTIVSTIRTFINEASMSDSLIKSYIDGFAEVAKENIKAESLKVYKSQVKKVLNLAKNHKAEVLEKADKAGSLNQWYQACLANTPPKRNQTVQVNAPKTGEETEETEAVPQPAKGFSLNPKSAKAIDVIAALIEIGYQPEELAQALAQYTTKAAA